MKEHYTKVVIPELKKELKIKNSLAVPKIQSVVINVGIGSYITKSGGKDFSQITENLKLITGQKPIIKKSKQAISNFKLRKGMPVGLKCTLRGKRMYDFITRLVNISLPRIRDFQGISVKSFDGQGNYNIGIKEHTIFPEINVDDVSKTHGLEISIVTNAKNDYKGYKLLKHLGFPFKDEITPSIN
jgi:large subunit ribosomal protein L5